MVLSCSPNLPAAAHSARMATRFTAVPKAKFAERIMLRLRPTKSNLKSFCAKSFGSNCFVSAVPSFKRPMCQWHHTYIQRHCKPAFFQHPDQPNIDHTSLRIPAHRERTCCHMPRESQPPKRITLDATEMAIWHATPAPQIDREALAEKRWCHQGSFWPGPSAWFVPRHTGAMA